MKYYGGCDSGSTYTKCVIIDETGKMVADVFMEVDKGGLAVEGI